MSVDEVPETGWKEVLQGQDENGRIVSLIHEDTAVLRRMAVFDVLVNNADRKGDHILAITDGHRYGLDHGLTFHSDHKLWTVLWGWIGEGLSAEELAGIDPALSELDGELSRNLDNLLTAEEIAWLATRCARLACPGIFPLREVGCRLCPDHCSECAACTACESGAARPLITARIRPIVIAEVLEGSRPDKPDGWGKDELSTVKAMPLFSLNR